MLNQTDVTVNSTSLIQHDFSIQRELFGTLSIFGLAGSVLALNHLFRIQKFKSPKRAFMLKCLMTLEFIGIMGMVTQTTVRYHGTYDSFVHNHTRIFCSIRIVWRCLSYCSGCVAFVMAIERYFALVKPFFYCRHFTNGLIKRLIFTFWTFSVIFHVTPCFGIGIFSDDIFLAEKCSPHQYAGSSVDIVYACICFLFGCSVLLFMVLCNFTVTRIVHRSYRNMEQLTISCLNDRINSNRQNPIKLCLEGSAISSERDTSNSTSFVTRDEIKFINLCNYLTASFVICWGIQLITIPIANFMENANQSRFIRNFFQVADLLLLLHFTINPYIYIILRTNYWSRFTSFLSKLLFKKKDEFVEIAKIDQ